MANIGQKWPSGQEILIPFLRDYAKKFHASDLARELKLPRRTIARKLEAFHDLHLLEYERKGKNKYFYFKLKDYSSFPLLVLLESSSELLFLQRHHTLAPLLKELAELCPLIIFGSYAKKLEKEDSDLDIVLFARKSKRIEGIIQKFPLPVQVQYATLSFFQKLLLTAAPLAKEIVKYHVLLGEKEKTIKLFRSYYLR